MSRLPWSVTCLSSSRRQGEFLATQNPCVSVADEDQKRSVRDEDEDVWPIRCPHCGYGFTARIRHLKSGVVGKCVSCSNDLGRSTAEFHLALSEARNGKLNPWWDMVRKMADHSPGLDVAQADRTSAQSDSDLVEQAFNLFLRMDAAQRAGLIARQQDRMAKEPAPNHPHRSPG